MRHLGAKHPQAYEEFVHNIQPSDVRVSRVKVGDINGAGGTLARQGDVMMEEPITAHRASGQQTLPPGTATVQVQKEREKFLSELIDSLPQDDVWSKVERSLSQVSVSIATRTTILYFIYRASYVNH